MPEDQIDKLDDVPWGVLNHTLSGDAKEVSRGADKLEGCEGWRLTTRHIMEGKAIRHEELRARVRVLHTEEIKSLEHVSHGIAKFDNVLGSTYRMVGHAC